MIHEDGEVDVGTSLDADEDPDVHVNAYGKDHEGKATNMDADQERM